MRRGIITGIITVVVIWPLRVSGAIVEIKIASMRSIEWSDTGLEWIDVGSSIGGIGQLIIKDSTGEVIYEREYVIDKGTLEVEIPPEYGVRGAGNGDRGVVIRGGSYIENRGEGEIRVEVYDVTGRKIKVLEIGAGSRVNVLEEEVSGVYIIKVPEIRRGYLVEKIKGVDRGVRVAEEEYSYVVQYEWGERKEGIEIMIIPDDTNYWELEIHPYYPEETLTNKNILIELIPKTITIHNPYTQRDTTIKITRFDLLDKYNGGTPRDPINMTLLHGWDNYVTTVYFQGDDTSAINTTKQIMQTYNQCIKTILDTNQLTIHTPPITKHQPTQKDTTGIGTEYEVPDHTSVIKVAPETGVGSRAWRYGETNSHQAYAYFIAGIATTPIYYFTGEELGTRWGAQDSRDPTSIFNPLTSDTLPSLRDVIQAIIAHTQQQLNQKNKHKPRKPQPHTNKLRILRDNARNHRHKQPIQ